DSLSGRVRQHLRQLYGIGNLRRQTAARLLRCLSGDPSPTLHALLSCAHQMRVSPVRNYGHNSVDTRLGRLFDRPFHAIKLENCQPERDTSVDVGLNALEFVRKAEHDLLLGHTLDPAQINPVSGDDFKLLPYTSAKYTSQVFGILPVKKSLIAFNFVRDPAASG